MPTTEPMAPGEVARLLERFENQTEGINAKLDGIRRELNDKPGILAFAEFKTDQAGIHAGLERKIDEVDARQTNARKDLKTGIDTEQQNQNRAIETLESRADRNLWGIVLVAVGAAVNLIVNVSGG